MWDLDSSTPHIWIEVVKIGETTSVRKWVTRHPKVGPALRVSRPSRTLGAASPFRSSVGVRFRSVLLRCVDSDKTVRKDGIATVTRGQKLRHIRLIH